jgi:hypothetical protein
VRRRGAAGGRRWDEPDGWDEFDLRARIGTISIANADSQRASRFRRHSIMAGLKDPRGEVCQFVDLR